MLKFQGFEIKHDADGYYWRNGPDGDGYFDTIEEAKASIAAYNRGPDDERVREAIGLPPLHRDDTPSLDTSFHDIEMDI